MWLIYGVQFSQILRAPYLLVGCGLASGSEAQQGLKRSHGGLATIVAKNELIKIDLLVLGRLPDDHRQTRYFRSALAAPTGAVSLRDCVEADNGVFVLCRTVPEVSETWWRHDTHCQRRSSSNS
jgi:hypothetical protein